MHQPLSIKALSISTLTQDDLKKLTTDKVVEYVKSNMVLSHDTSSSITFMVHKLGELLKSDQ